LNENPLSCSKENQERAVSPVEMRNEKVKELFKTQAFIIVITAPSGAGKTTVIHRLLESNPRLSYSISATTRPRRDCEADGRDYFFIDEAEFKRRLSRGEFAESARVHGYLYGTLTSQIEAVLAENRHVLMDVDIQGASQLRKRYPDGVFIYLMPPSMQELERRLATRATEDSASLKLRLKNSLDEIKAFPLFDYLVVNYELDCTCEEILRIIRAEELKVSRLPDTEELLEAYLGPHRQRGSGESDNSE